MGSDYAGSTVFYFDTNITTEYILIFYSAAVFTKNLSTKFELKY